MVDDYASLGPSRQWCGRRTLAIVARVWPSGAAGRTPPHRGVTAIEHVVALASADTDFARSTEITWINPLAKG